MEEDDADECAGVKNRCLSESVSEDAWPIGESDGEAGVAGDSELDAPDVPSPKGIPHIEDSRLPRFVTDG